jgi:hypothetical protein
MLVDRNSNVISQRDVIDLQPKNTATEFPLKKIQSSENLDSKKQKTEQKEEQQHLAMRENPGERKEMEMRTSMSSKDQRPNSFTSG